MACLLLLIALVPQLTGVLCSVTTSVDQTVLAGQPITVPCHYSHEYALNVKFWCKGHLWTFCSSLARTDKSDPLSEARITIADDPTQFLFTVHMRELMEEDSGWYWCGVEIGGIWKKDSAKSLYISVIQGISVAKTEVRGEEGGGVTVQCLYSEKHRKNEKLWCRSGHDCKVTNNGTFNSDSLTISDDRKDTVTVTMRQLEMRDAGWYWCGAGEHKASVDVTVTPRVTTTAVLDVKAQHESDTHTIWHTVFLVLLGVLLCSLGLATWMTWKQCKRIRNHRTLDETEAELTVRPSKIGGWKTLVLSSLKP